MIFFGILDRLKAKYIFSGALLLLFLLPVLGMALPGGVQHPATPERQTPPDSTPTQAVQKSRRETRREIRRLQREADRPPTAETRTEEEQDSLFDTRIDSIFGAPPLSPIAPADSTAPTGNDSLLRDSLRQDTTQRDTTRKKSFLDDIISGKNQDSLYYDVRNRTVYIYNQGDINYQNMNLKGDFMRVNMDEKIIYAHGKRDTIDGKPTVTNPTFTEGAANPYTMDTITYNIGSKKAKIKGVATQEGDGWLIGNNVKKMDDNTIHIQDGKYTTCDQTDHPHFYLAMTKAKVIPGKKVVTGPAYLVLEDVPIYFPLLPEGFFPLSSGPKSGLLMPTFGEESTKGFYIRDLGYYFTLGEHMDLAIRGGIYTLGSWEASAMSRYMKRYKYNGTLNFNYSNVRVGDKGEPDFLQQNNFQLYWQHTQDPKANPGSTFSASVDFRTSGYNRYSATSLNEALQTQTSSTISYSKSWLGTPFSLSANMSVSQNSQSGTLSIALPNVVFNVSTFYPFKRKEAMGKQRWYEKISLRYTGKFNNKANAKESEIFTKETLQNMQYGFEHSIPISATYNIFNYINFGPTINYTEKWYFKKQEQVWNPVLNRIDKLDPEYGFYRLYNYNFSLQASTIIYGRYEAKKKTRKIQAIRHTITPTVSFSYAPDFSKQKYGYVKTVQSDTLGNFKTYSPFEGSIFGVPSSGQSMAINASLSQTLEMKVLSKRDTSGMKKIKLIDERLHGTFEHPHFAAHDRFPKFRHQYQRYARPLPGHPAGPAYQQTLFPGPCGIGQHFVRLYVPIPPGQLHPGDQRHQQRPGRSGLRQSFLRPLRANEPGPATAIHDPGLLRLLATLEPGIQLYGQLLRITDQQRHDGLPEKHHPNARHQRQRYDPTQDGHNIPRRLRLPGQGADSGLHHHFARPALLANVVRVGPLRPLSELEFQHRRQSGFPRRPEIRQKPEHVRQFILNFGRFHA